jgi:hypothetical protein
LSVIVAPLYEELAELANWLMASKAGSRRAAVKTGRPSCCGAGDEIPAAAALLRLPYTLEALSESIDD